MKKLFCVLAALLLAFSSASAVTDLSTIVSISLNGDGSAHVKERYDFLLEDALEIEEFEAARIYGENTILGWRRFSSGLRYHLSAAGTPLNTKISASRLLDSGSRFARIELDYEVVTSVVNEEQLGPRVKKLTLDAQLLAFDFTSSREIIFPSVFTLRIAAPSAAVVDRNALSPEPSLLAGNTAEWKGPLTAKLSFAYTVEKPLNEEVSEYFNGLYKQGVGVIPGAVPVAIILLFVLFLANKALKQRKKL